MTTIDTQAAAAYWAATWGKNALLSDCRIGEAFQFKAGGDICRKLSATRYVVEDGTGRKYSTGKHVAVIRGY